MAIIIAAKRHGFRRCGIAHSSEPTLYRDDHFTSAQLQALAQDPQLVVSYADADLDDQKELLNGTSPIQEASITSESALQSLGQADPAAMGNAGPNLQGGASLGLNLPPLAGGEIDLGIEALWGEALLEDAQRSAVKLAAETEALWDEAFAEDAQREAAKVKATDKPKKTTGKTGVVDK